MEEPQVTPVEPIVPVKPPEIRFLIPECCREGWESCTHVAKKQKPRKRNIGL